MNSQIRFQKMMTCIYENYAEPLMLEDIAKAADISRSDACGFHSVNYFSRQFKKKLLFKVEGNHDVKTKEL